MMRYKNNELYINILKEIKSNSKITEKELAKKYEVTERTIRRYFKELKNNNIIKLIRNGNLREWHIL